MIKPCGDSGEMSSVNFPIHNVYEIVFTTNTNPDIDQPVILEWKPLGENSNKTSNDIGLELPLWPYYSLCPKVGNSRELSLIPAVISKEDPIDKIKSQNKNMVKEKKQKQGAKRTKVNNLLLNTILKLYFIFLFFSLQIQLKYFQKVINVLYCQQ